MIEKFIRIMKKKRCLACKRYFNESNMIKSNFGYFHNEQCRQKYGADNISKLLNKVKVKAKKENAAKKRKFYDNDLKTRKAAAKKACHDYIRKRDAGLNCICCNEPMTGQIHAGHFLESGNNPLIRYDEDNIHAQRAYCNTYKGGDSGDYERNLRIKIGDERVDALLKKRFTSCKRTVDDYKQIEQYYKEKLNKFLTK